MKCLIVLILSLSAVLAQDPCDGSNPPPVITASHSIIETPNGGNGTTYEANSLCEWIILAPSDSERAVLNFNIFLLEECTDCHCDYMEVYDGPDDQGTLLGRYCGNQDNLVVPVGYETFIRFVSDATFGGVGFKAVVTFEDAACAGGANIYDRDGVITSPNYPNNYDESSFCSWRLISSDPDKRVALTFNDFSVEPGCSPSGIYDYVTFDDNSDGSRMGYWYGDIATGDFSYISYSNSATVSFRSDFTLNARGFNMSFTFVPKSQ